MNVADLRLISFGAETWYRLSFSMSKYKPPSQRPKKPLDLLKRFLSYLILLRVTLAKFEDLQLITLGKKGNESHKRSAQSILISSNLLPKVFNELATRYRNRPGGYTRIQRYGHRPGDNAPKAILELVDGPRDTKFEMVARKVGWEIMEWKAKGEHTGLYKGIERGVESIEVRGGNASYLDEKTRAQISKVFRFRPRSDRVEFGIKAAQHLVCSGDNCGHL
jgi:large subunit ribosomal protein L17